MKTLKKVLSLVLVVAMIASMLIVGAAATEETKYDEAVAVVTGLGIIEGDENGYNFTGNLTREQAAKIIAYMLLGKDTAEALKTTTAPFADVAANRWSAGYIAYLKGQGIISGVSDTEFDPTANVTGVAFAKMLLTAIGYGKADEFEGAQWDINTITFANQNGIYEGTEAADIAAAATREEAMLYLFNALQVPTVNYNKTFESYYVGTSPLQDVADPSVYTLGALNYDLAKIPGTSSDDYGRPASTWVADGVTLAADIACENPDYVLYGTVNSAVLYNTLGKAVVTAINADNAWTEITVIENGGAGTPVTSVIAAGYYTNYIATAGATTELYVDFVSGAYQITAVVYYEQIGKVTRVDATNNTITIDGSIVVDGDLINITGLVKNDYVIYTKGLTAVSALRKAVATVGTYTGTNYMAQSVIDGVGYSVSTYAHASASSLVLDTTYEFYYDAQGNILMAVEYDDAAATNNYNYIYVTYSEAQAWDPSSILNGKDAKVVLTAVYPNGGAALLNYAIKYNTTLGYYITMPDGTDTAVANGSMIAAGWYAYTTNENGDVTLKDINTTYAAEETGLVLTTNKATVTAGANTYTANSKTVLTIVDVYGNSVTYTGIANFPVISAAYPTLVTHAKDSVLAKSIVAYSAAPLTTAATYGYCVFQWSADSTGYTYMFYVNGAAQFITLDSTITAGLVYELTTTAGVYAATYVDTVNDQFGEGWTMDFNTYATLWYETATIDTVDDNFFTTVAVSAEDAADSIIGTAVGANLYYYDANTVIYDCVNGGIATELPEGAAFLAKTTTTNSSWYGETYCEYIWIVG